MAFERVAEFEVFVEHGVAFVPAELLEPGRVNTTIHAGGERAALEAVAADLVGVEPGLGGAGLVRATVPASIALVPTTGAGRGPSPTWCRVGGTKMRRNTAPVVMFAASCQQRSARCRSAFRASVRPLGASVKGRRGQATGTRAGLLGRILMIKGMRQTA